MLPFLFSLGLPALASTGALGATLGGMSGAALAGMGAGLGSFFETGDVGKGIKTGMLSFLGGKLLGGMGGGVAGLKDSAAADAVLSGSAQASMGQGAFKEAVKAAGTNVPFQGILGDNVGSAFLQPGVMTAASIGSVANAAQREPEKREDGERFEPPLPSSLKRQVSMGDPMAGSGEQTYFDYTYTPNPELEYPYIDYGTLQEKNRNVKAMSLGGIASMGGGHPMFMGLGRGISSALSQSHGPKIQAFVQKVENDARAEFGDDLFQAPQVATQMPTQMARLPQMRLNALDQARGNRRADINTTDEFLLGGGGGGRNPNYTGPITPTPSFSDVMAQAGKGGGLSNTEARFEAIPPNAMIRPINMFQNALGMAEGGEVESMNEKDIILESIKAIKGMKEDAEAQEILGMFLATYGEEALRDLVSSVQSGEFDETVERFKNGDNGIVRGPGDGSGSDDKVPATLDNQQDVLLTEGEYVFREPTTDALTKAYGGGFLDKINEAEGDAPEVLRKMVG